MMAGFTRDEALREIKEIAGYAHYLQENPQVWQLLREQTIPALLASRPAATPRSSRSFTAAFSREASSCSVARKPPGNSPTCSRLWTVNPALSESYIRSCVQSASSFPHPSPLTFRIAPWLKPS